MIITRWAAPSRHLSSVRVSSSFATHREENLLFAYRTDRMEVGRHAGGFSLKVVTHGAEHYQFGRREATLSPGRVLLTNAGEEYSSRIAVPGTVAISLFLCPATLADLAGALRQPDAPPDTCGRDHCPEVGSIPFRPSAASASALRQVAAAVGTVGAPDPVGVEELALAATARVLADALALLPPARPGWRASTRAELLARLLPARELIEERGGRIGLAQMAEAAALSRYHFLRAFAATFGKTPGQFAREVRLRRAVALMNAGVPARRAAGAAGFASSSTLLRSLRRQ